MKIFTLAPRENWICDRFVNEWNSHNSQYTANSPEEADIIWLLADWCWNHINIETLRKKIVVASVHHIVPEKFNNQEFNNFKFRDKLVDYYHVPCIKTREQIESLTSKPIFTYPFWVNGEIWKSLKNKSDLRRKYGIKQDSFLIGSFQRDTEGHDLKSPKLEKGPDLLFECIKQVHATNNNTEVLLAGWRRQYIINRLDKAGIKFYYYELPDFSTINEFYNCLDLYVVSARYEGGPQAIVECALNKTPIVSTDVGLASEILHTNSIYEMNNFLKAKPDIDHAFKKVNDFIIPEGFSPYIEFFNNIHKGSVI